MIRTGLFGLCVAVLCSIGPASAKTERHSQAKHEFRKAHPCPSTAQHAGPCPGWVVDHITPLCADGADSPNNMQWQRLAESLAKDRDERAHCRLLRRRNAESIMPPKTNQ